MNKWNWLREYVQKNNITQAEAAEALQWQKPRISELLSGKRDFPGNKILLAARFFGLDLEELTKYNSGFTKDIPSIKGKRNIIKKESHYVELDILDTAGNQGKNLAITPIGKQNISYDVLKLLTDSNPQDIKILISHGDAMQPTINNGDAVWVDTSVTSPAGDGLYLFTIKGELFVKRLFFDDFNGVISIISDNSLYPPINIRNKEKISTLGKIIAIFKIVK